MGFFDSRLNLILHQNPYLTFLVITILVTGFKILSRKNYKNNQNVELDA